LFEGSNRILFSYLDVVVADDPTYSSGAFATVGIRDVDGQLNGRNLLWSHHQAAVTDGMHLFIAPQNRPPVTVCDSAATAKNTPVSIPVLTNDSDPDGDPLTITGVSPTNGTASIVGTNVVFSPAVNFSGSASVGYTISDGFGGTASALITVSVTNQPPLAVNDSASTDEDTPVVLNVLTDDADPDGDPLTIIAVSTGTNGRVVINTNETVTYQPATNFYGLDGFTYTISDGYGGTATGAVSVSVWPVNDPPLLAAISDRTIFEGETLMVVNMASDPDMPVNMLTFSLETNAPAGAVINPTNGVFTWTPDETQWPGTNTITVRVTDDGSPNLSAARSFTVVALRTNRAPVFVGCAVAAPGQFRLRGIGTVGWTYTLQTSTNLVNWVNHTNLIAGPGGLIEYLARMQASVSICFFRLRWPADPTVSRPTILGLARQSDGRIQLQATGTPGLAYTLQTSTNLVNWVNHTNLVAGSTGLIECVEETKPDTPACFYRLKWP
jgi:hypothetical protein